MVVEFRLTMVAFDASRLEAVTFEAQMLEAVTLEELEAVDAGRSK
jgi:hypothetical protein